MDALLELFDVPLRIFDALCARLNAIRNAKYRLEVKQRLQELGLN
jgi:hypothetical protein